MEPGRSQPKVFLPREPLANWEEHRAIALRQGLDWVQALLTEL
ncbi:MAG: hypothetical protein AAF405_03775 [Pseudomonadota bacterium]